MSDLRAPTSPAFTLLDVAPTSVARPESPRALVVNVVSTLAKSEGFPQNYALEVTPYWLRVHPGLTYANYYKPTISQTLLRTASLSIATTKLADSDSPGTSLALGLRGLILRGRPNASLEKYHDSLLAELRKIQEALLEIADPANPVNKRIGQLTALRKPKIDEANATADIHRWVSLQGEIKELDAAIAGVDAELTAKWNKAKAAAKETALAIQGLDSEPVGFLLAYAGALAWEFPGDRFEDRQLSRWGAWLTPSYRFVRCLPEEEECHATFEIIGVVRYLRDELGATAGRFDVGGRLLWQAQKSLALSAEFVQRSAAPDAGLTRTHRATLVIEYQVSDGSFLYGSFGRDFEEEGTRRNLVSIVGVNFGFGTKPLLDFTR